MDHWLLHKNILAAYFLLLLLNFSVAIQDIALNAWCLTLLPKNKVGSGATIAYVGITLGIFIGYNLFTPLNTSEFIGLGHSAMSNFFFAGNVTNQTFLWGFAIYCCITAFSAHICLAEKHEMQTVMTYKQVVGVIHGFWYNKN